MDLIKASLQAPVLGRDFLTWLFAMSDMGDDTFNTQDDIEFVARVEQKVSLTGGQGENVKRAAYSQATDPEFSEAKLSIANGKYVDRAMVSITVQDADFTVMLKADDFTLNGLRTPKIETRLEEGDDPDAPLYEKIALVELVCKCLDSLYSHFLGLRLNSARWVEQVRRVRAWTKED